MDAAAERKEFAAVSRADRRVDGTLGRPEASPATQSASRKSSGTVGGTKFTFFVSVKKRLMFMSKML